MKYAKIFVIAFLSICVSISSGSLASQEIAPSDAIFCGGIDGGVLVLARSVPSGPAEVKVFNLSTRELVAHGPAIHMGNEVLASDVMEMCEGWDGVELYLSDGRSLRLSVEEE
ncbi:MAG: hypothetical protein AAGF45_09160 [Pseudomonadota bacterium]